MRVCEACRRDVAALEVAGAALCLRCAREIEADFVSGESSLISALASPAETSGACSFCGATIEEIERDGLVGCWKCYETFGERVLPDADPA